MFRYLSAGLLCALWGAPASAAPSEVTVIATIHGLHAKSTGYSYDTLYRLVNDIHPDYVGVEIRQEDLGRDPAYLAANYPAEMIHEAQAWGAFGFDWLGDDVAGRAVPSDWWAKQSPLKQLERDMDADAAFKDTRLDEISAAEHAILATATPAGMNDGRYDRLNDAYYDRLAQVTAGSKYAALSRFYASRDAHIDANIATAIAAHPGSRFVILTGADHRGALLRYLARRFGDSIRLLPIQSP